MATQSLEFKSGLDDSKFQAGLKNMEKGAKASTGKISGMMKGIGIMAAATAALGAAKGIANMTGDLSDQANQLNMNVENMQKLQGVMALGGTDADKFVMGMQKIGVAMTTAREEGGPTLENFEKMGISFTQLADAGDDTEKVFRLMSDALQKSNGALSVHNAALEIIGTRQGKMVGTMKAGTAAIDEQAKSVFILTARQVEYGDRASDIVGQEIENAKKLGAAKLLMGGHATGKFGGMKDKVDAPTFRRFEGADPRRLAAEKKALELRKASLQVLIQTTEEAHKASQESAAAARESLMAALSGQRATRPTSRERSISRMMESLESPTQRKTGLQTSGLGGRRFGETIMGGGLATGKLTDQYRSLSARSGVGKALSEFAKAKQIEKQNAENLATSTALLKEIERGINGN
jgi:hypothetical protein